LSVFHIYYFLVFCTFFILRRRETIKSGSRLRWVVQLNSWLMQIGLATVGQNGDMGANLSTARDFLDLHERLAEDMKVSLCISHLKLSIN